MASVQDVYSNDPSLSATDVNLEFFALNLLKIK